MTKVKDQPNELFVGKREYFDLLLTSEINKYNSYIDNLGKLHQKTFGVLFVVFILFMCISTMVDLVSTHLDGEIQKTFLTMFISNIFCLFIVVMLCLKVIMPKETYRVAQTQYFIDEGFLDVPVEKLTFALICNYWECNDLNQQAIIERNKTLICSLKIMVVNIIFFAIICLFYVHNV